ncbi:hypothetical protein NDU88_005793 [Pleurodeles waltl]|uniref:Uncharacterized protein n=1 Tax=Pleurodeles waltl TaxID=8319 RepID=A0AAV7L5N0_PLEWA|nr:hypothetical protein NDU88_005793 [Pleurodeles waltl]
MPLCACSDGSAQLRATPGASGPDRVEPGPCAAPARSSGGTRARAPPREKTVRPAGRCFTLGGRPVRPSRSGPGSPQSTATGAEGVGSNQLNQEGSAQPPWAPSGIRAAAAAADAPRTTGGALLTSSGAAALRRREPRAHPAPHPVSGTPPIQGIHVLGFP